MDKDFETFYKSLRNFVIETYGDKNAQLIIDYLIWLWSSKLSLSSLS